MKVPPAPPAQFQHQSDTQSQPAQTVPQIGFESRLAQFDYFDVVNTDDIYQRKTGKEVEPGRPHRVTFHTLIYFNEGSGAHQIDFEQIPVVPGTIVFVKVNQVHAFDTLNRPQGKLLIFTSQFIDLLRSSIRVSALGAGNSVFPQTSHLHLPEALHEQVAFIFGELTAMDKQQSFAPDLLQLLFSTLLVRLHQLQQSDSQGSGNRQLRQKYLRFLSLVEQDFKVNRNAVDYARNLGCSYKSLNEACRALGQDTPKRIIDAYTILEAKRCLAIDRLPTTQVAFSFGFGEVSNFVKYFKKYTGVTPSQFQKQSTGSIFT